jgi:mono/diheme cytochrome c family protein
LFGKLRLAGDVDRQLHLLVTKERAVAWTVQAEDKDEGLLRRLVEGIYLIETLNRFPDQRQAESISVDDLQVANLGVSKESGNRMYVIEAKQNEGESRSARLSGLDSERILIKFSVEDLMPKRVSAIAANGSHLDLTFESIKTDVGDDLSQPIAEPPKDSLVIELSGSSKAGAGLKNPVPYTAESIRRGKLLYIADCEVCHSVDGTGRDSDVTDNAADLTSTEFWLSDGSEAATFLAIRDGAGDEMPGYKDDYRDETMIWDLVNYIRSLQK